VGHVPRVEGSALPLGDVAAGAGSSCRLRTSVGVVWVALGDVGLWDVIPMGPEGGGGDPRGEVHTCWVRWQRDGRLPVAVATSGLSFGMSWGLQECGRCR
jgi:hypothetical protein